VTRRAPSVDRPSHTNPEDWRLEVAGQRVQIIKPDAKRGGVLEFGKEIVAASDHSLVALLGASPEASTALFIATKVLERCFENELTNDRWLHKLKEMIPSYGESLIENAELCRQVCTETAAVLHLEDIAPIQHKPVGRTRSKEIAISAS
jgi:malate dehydrogenase (quinone)